ncbi:hypothetical protein AAEX28_04525 [Lentisphaerota bacterium WC36G]|nr:hypothetical protein LJT99_07385 [Lentisphaerae bacterium WC36]
MKHFNLKHILLYCCYTLTFLTACQLTEFADYSSAYNMNATYSKDKSGNEFVRVTGIIATDQRGVGKITTQTIGNRMNVYITIVPGGEPKVNQLIPLPKGVDEVYLGDSTDLLWIRSVEEEQALKRKKELEKMNDPNYTEPPAKERRAIIDGLQLVKK